MSQKFISHRCKELLEYNKDASTKVCIRKVVKLDMVDKTLHKDKWCLYCTEDDMDYDVIHLIDVGEIKYCPYCKKELERK